MVESAAKRNADVANEYEIEELELDKLVLDNNLRERKLSDPDIKELGEAIAAQGVINPILVRPHPKRIGFDQVVHGHGRCLGSKVAGKKTIPGRRRDLTDQQVVEIQLQKNMQRKDLSELEEASAFQAYLKATASTQQQLADKIGKSQPYIANRLRLLELNPAVQEHIRRGMLTPSHGELLLQIPKEFHGEQAKVSKRLVREKATVQDAKRIIQIEVRDMKERVEIAHILGSSEHKRCPECKRPAEARETAYGANMVRCEFYHKWDAKTGKAWNYREESRSRSSGKSGKRPAAPPPPPAIEQSPVVRSGHDLKEILIELVRQMPVDKIRGLHISHGDWFTIEMTDDYKWPFRGQMWFGPTRFTSGEKSAMVVEYEGRAGGAEDARADSKERQAAKASFVAWERKSLKKVKLKPGTRKVDTSILDTDKVTEVKDAIESFSVEELELLRTAEMRGKKRHNYVRAIDEQIGSQVRFS